MDQQSQVPLFDLQLDHSSTQYLSEAAKWGKFLSIVGFIMVGFLVLLSFFMGSIFSSMGNMEAYAMMGGGVVTFIYLILAGLWFMPILYLYRFSSKMQIAIRSNDQQTLSESFKNLKGCFRFMGIVTIVVLSFYALALIIGIGAAVGMR